MPMLPCPNDSIGIFDSGLGGLTVLRALQERLPHENFIYLGDTARIPYGNKTKDTLARYGEECCKFLVQKQVKLIIIACHSLSSVALETLKSSFQVPILGMVESSLSLLSSLKKDDRLVLLGTRRTIDSQIYEKALREKERVSSLVCLACPLFVSLVEEGHISDPMSDLVVKKTLAPLKELNPTFLFLACTHYPFLKKSIQKTVKGALILDPADRIADKAASLLKELNIENHSLTTGTTRFFVTDDPLRFASLKSKLFTSKNEPVELAIF